jgi:dihydrofolate reductase
MRKIIAGTFVTLDGVMEAPGSGDTTLPDHRGWSEPFMNEEIGNIIIKQMMESDALLLGRKTYQGFADFWPAMPDENPFARQMNGIAKYVVSTTLKKVEWNNSTLITGNILEGLSNLKKQPGKNIQVTGSGELINFLLQQNLIDELQLMVCPVVLGVGRHLFTQGNVTKFLELSAVQAFNSGMVLLSYLTK